MPKRRRSHVEKSDSDWEPDTKEPSDDEENVPPVEDSESELEEPPKKRRRKSVSQKRRTSKKKKAKGSKRTAPPRFTKKLLADLKRPLNQHVKTFANMVDRDWHDGYEEQGEELMDYFASLQVPFQTVYNFARVHKRDYKMCHELLKYIGDTWARILCVPARGGISDVMGCSDHDWELNLTEIGETQSFRSSMCMDGLLSYFWTLLLLSMCADEDCDSSGSVLNQYIRDAKDLNARLDTKVPDDDDEDEDECPQIRLLQLREGCAELESLVQSGGWQSCPTTKKTHRMRRCIDRRFDGPRHLRTRDYGWSDEDDFSDGFMDPAQILVALNLFGGRGSWLF